MGIEIGLNRKIYKICIPGLLMKVYVLFSLVLLSLFAVSAQSCDMKASSTDDFFGKISEFNAKLVECPIVIPSPIDKLFGDDIVNVQIVRNDGSKDVFTIVTKGSRVISIEKGGSDDPTYVATLAECALDNVLKSNNRAGALAYLYDSGHLTIGASGIWRSIVFRVALLFAGGAIEDASETVDVTCPERAVGELCEHGGQCATGNCIYVTGEGAGRIYKCSCDPFKFDAFGC